MWPKIERWNDMTFLSLEYGLLSLSPHSEKKINEIKFGCTISMKALLTKALLFTCGYAKTNVGQPTALDAKTG